MVGIHDLDDGVRHLWASEVGTRLDVSTSPSENGVGLTDKQENHGLY